MRLKINYCYGNGGPENCPLLRGCPNLGGFLNRGSTVLFYLSFSVIPNLEWHGVIFVRSGPYQSGVFRFTIYIPDGWVIVSVTIMWCHQPCVVGVVRFPHLQPMVRFHSRVSHPYVHVSNGWVTGWVFLATYRSVPIRETFALLTRVTSVQIREVHCLAGVCPD